MRLSSCVCAASEREPTRGSNGLLPGFRSDLTPLRGSNGGARPERFDGPAGAGELEDDPDVLPPPAAPLFDGGVRLADGSELECACDAPCRWRTPGPGGGFVRAPNPGR